MVSSIIICKVCKEKKELRGKEMCEKCYRINYRQENKERIAKVSHVNYLRNRDKNILNTLKWRNNNKDRWDELHRKASKKYKKTKKGLETISKFNKKYKEQNTSRNNTHSIIFGHRRYKPLDLPKSFFKCKICGDLERIEIHHEIYPKYKVDIVKAIEEGKIYMLCKKHHTEIHKNFNSQQNKITDVNNR